MLFFDEMRWDPRDPSGRLERNDQAVLEFEAAASIQPQNSEPQVYLALTYQLMGRFPDALAAARRAFAIDPKASNVKLTNAVRSVSSERSSGR